MTAAEGVIVARDITGDGVIVGMAEPGGSDANQHLTSLRIIELQRLDLPLSAVLPQDRATCLHDFLVSVPMGSVPRCGLWLDRAGADVVDSSMTPT